MCNFFVFNFSRAKTNFKLCWIFRKIDSRFQTRSVEINFTLSTFDRWLAKKYVDTHTHTDDLNDLCNYGVEFFSFVCYFCADVGFFLIPIEFLPRVCLNSRLVFVGSKVFLSCVCSFLVSHSGKSFWLPRQSNVCAFEHKVSKFSLCVCGHRLISPNFGWNWLKWKFGSMKFTFGTQLWPALASLKHWLNE